MGFTPLEGLVMATRSGSIDPGLVLWLIDRGLAPADVLDVLEHRSGLAGLTGGTGDMRDVLAAVQHGDAGARLALDVYVHRVAAGVAAMAVSLGGVDAVAFTGGVGEHAHEVRAAVADRLAFLGVALDVAANVRANGDADITASGAGVRSVVVTAREDVEMARQVRDLL
jgi:acetate kinase